MDRIVCELCKKKAESSKDFPSWCKSCSIKYGDMDEEPTYQPLKKKKRKHGE